MPRSIHPARLMIVLIMALSFSTCKDDPVPNDPAPEALEFPGIVFRDEYGNHLGTYGGTDDNDWKYDTLWAQEIMELMDFEDTVGLSGTFLESTYQPPEKLEFYFFPNPVHTNASAYMILPGKVKVKMVLADTLLSMVATYCYMGSDTSWTILDMADTARFIEGAVYRLYYTFSVEGNENFYKGHGDVFICHDIPPNTCLRYLDND